jgi:ribosomal protein L11 methyltransferase
VIRLAVRCPPEIGERVLAELLELAPGGIEEDEGDGYVEYAIYGAPGELPSLPDLDAVAGPGTVEVTTEEIPDDWADRWRDFHRPVEVGGGRLVVRPSWEEGADGEPETGIAVVIDPGQAFGTGAHATTRMCLEFLLELADAGEAHGPLVDLGTGSGVLAIAAAKLGFDPVTGCDHERAALEAAGANAEANGVTIELERRNLRQEPPPPAPTMTANLTAPILHEVTKRLDALAEPDRPQSLICSGLLRREADEIAKAFAARGLTERRRLADGDWTALLLTRP